MKESKANSPIQTGRRSQVVVLAVAILAIGCSALTFATDAGATFLNWRGAATDNYGVPAPKSIAQKNKVVDVPVTTTILSADANIAPALQIGNDGASSYPNTKDVQSLIQSVGDWVMQSDFSTVSTRTVFVDFGKPIAGSCATCPNGNPIAMPSQLYPTRFIAKCHEYNANMFTLAFGATMQCPMYTRVIFNGDNYRINMNPNPAAQGYYPETNDVNITCTGMDSLGKCNKWKLEPSGYYMMPDGSVARGNVGKLVKPTTFRGKTVDVDQGDFYFSFSIQVTNP
jgi:hypothetical protein